MIRLAVAAVSILLAVAGPPGLRVASGAEASEELKQLVFWIENKLRRDEQAYVSNDLELEALKKVQEAIKKGHFDVGGVIARAVIDVARSLAKVTVVGGVFVKALDVGLCVGELVAGNEEAGLKCVAQALYTRLAKAGTPPGLAPEAIEKVLKDQLTGSGKKSLREALGRILAPLQVEEEHVLVVSSEGCEIGTSARWRRTTPVMTIDGDVNCDCSRGRLRKASLRINAGVWIAADSDPERPVWLGNPVPPARFFRVTPCASLTGRRRIDAGGIEAGAIYVVTHEGTSLVGKSENGEVPFEGTLSGSQFVGTTSTKYPPGSGLEHLPQSKTELFLTVSDDGDSMTGKYKGEIRNPYTGKLLRWQWLEVRFTRVREEGR